MEYNDIFGLPTKRIDLSQAINIQLDRIVGGRSVFIDESSLFLALFGTIPNRLYDSDNDCKQSLEWFIDNHREEITDSYFEFSYQKKTYYRKLMPGEDPFGKDEVLSPDEVELENAQQRTAVPRFNFVCLVLQDDLLLMFELRDSTVKLLFRETPIDKALQLLEGIRKFPVKEKGNAAEIKLIVNGDFSIETTKIPINRPKLSIEDNYNDDFKPIHEAILKKLNMDNEKGVVILHGKPGTGKTNYIRYLITSIQKDIIFLPPNMAGSMVNPEFINLLTDNINSVLVIEDAENIMIDRKANGGSPVSSLLNIADGLLSDCLSIQIICSFNTDLSKIDPALLRKGRLIGKYEFNELSTEKSQALSNKLGFNTTITEPMTLAAIYNQDDLDFDKEKKNSIGFKK